MVECEWVSLIWYNGSMSVLIDTWWNVNYVGQVEVFMRFLRFNRYMVECEFVNVF